MDKQTITNLVEAIDFLNNEALRLRDQAKATRSIPESYKLLSQKKDQCYSLKNDIVQRLFKEQRINPQGHILQRIDENENFVRIFVAKVRGDENQTEVTVGLSSSNPPKIFSKKLREINGLIPFEKKETDLTLERAIETIESYLKSPVKISTRKKSNKKQKVVYPIKETKLVELSKLVVNMDVYKTPPKEETYREKKESVERKLSASRGKYSKDIVIIARKMKNPEDRRKVIYRIEIGYANYLVLRDMGIEKAYVQVIDEDKEQ